MLPNNLEQEFDEELVEILSQNEIPLKNKTQKTDRKYFNTMEKSNGKLK